MSIVISIIGCITGCTGLIISLYRAYLERGKLSIYSKPKENLYFPKAYGGYATNNQGVIFLRLINRSIYPITIYDISVKIGSFKYGIDIIDEDVLKVPSSEYLFGPEPVTLNVDMTPKLTLPYVIPPFNIYQGYVFLPQVPDFTEQQNDITVLVCTSRKRHPIKYRTTIRKWDVTEITSKFKIIDDPNSHDDQ